MTKEEFNLETCKSQFDGYQFSHTGIPGNRGLYCHRLLFKWGDRVYREPNMSTFVDVDEEDYAQALQDIVKEIAAKECEYPISDRVLMQVDYEYSGHAVYKFSTQDEVMRTISKVFEDYIPNRYENEPKEPKSDITDISILPESLQAEAQRALEYYELRMTEYKSNLETYNRYQEAKNGNYCAMADFVLGRVGGGQSGHGNKFEIEYLK